MVTWDQWKLVFIIAYNCIVMKGTKIYVDFSIAVYFTGYPSTDLSEDQIVPIFRRETYKSK